MSQPDDLTGLRAFVRDDGWTQLFEAVLAEHYGRRSDALDRDVLAGAWAAGFEDFVTRTYAGRGNAIEAYLSGAGQWEAPRVKAYLKAFRGSVPSVYEVVETRVGMSVNLRDLVRGGQVVTLADRGMHFAGCWIVARLIWVEGRRETTGTLLGVARPEDQQAMMGVVKVALGKTSPPPWFWVSDKALRGCAPEMTRLWVEQAMG